MIIAICGNIACGKTTFSKQLCKHIGYTYVPQRRSELDFLKDFFQEVPRYFYSTQSSFILNKSIEINDIFQENDNIVIDRSIFEDIHVFAKYWKDNYIIDKREVLLYDKLADYILSQTASPDIYIVCKCDLAVIKERLDNRELRDFESKYPVRYLENLDLIYKNLKFPSNRLVIEVNTEIFDFSNDDNFMCLINEINDIITFNNDNRMYYHYRSRFKWCRVLSLSDYNLKLITKT